MADGKDDPNLFVIDQIYEFSAPRFYDFINGETEDDMRKAELWFEITSSYAPSRTRFFLFFDSSDLSVSPLCNVVFTTSISYRISLQWIDRHLKF